MATVAVPGRRFDVDAVVFDKDGTLIDLHASWGPPALTWLEAVGGGDDRMRDVLADRLGFDLPNGRLVPDGVFAAGTLAQIGSETLAALRGQGWDDARVRATISRAREAVAVAIESTPPVTLADLPALFGELAAVGVGRAVLTSDDREPTLDFLRRAGVGHLVDTVVGGDEVANPKPHPEGLALVMAALAVRPDRVLMVGDSLADHRAARAAGTWFVAVGVGSAAAEGADAAIESVAAITVRGRSRP